MKTLGILFLITLLGLPHSFAQSDAQHACGAASLYHLATLLGKQASLEDVGASVKMEQQRTGVASFTELIDCGKAFGLELQGVKLTYPQLQTFKTPVIAHLKTTFADEKPAADDDSTIGHFIVVEATTEKWVRLFDEPRSTLRESATVVSRDRFLELWSGKALVLSQRQRAAYQPVLRTNPKLMHFPNGRLGEYGVPVQIVNRNEVPLKINNVATDCACTVVDTYDSIIPANSAAFMEVKWDAAAANRSLFTTIQIETDDLKRPHTFVSMGVLREFSVVSIPEKLSIQGTGDSDIIRTVELQNLNETAVKIEKMEASQPWIRPVLRGNARISPWRRADVELHFEGAQVPTDETLNETFTVHYVDHSGAKKSFTVPISGRVNGLYRLTPNRFFFGRIKTDEQQIKTVILQNMSGTDMVIANVETDVGTVIVNRLEEKDHYEVLLTLPPLLTPGILKGKVRIETNHPKNPRITVPVFALVID